MAPLQLVMTPDASATPTCTREEARRAESEASSLRTWQQIFESHQRFRNCDDGAISEGYSGSVAELLANHWDQTEQLLSLPHAQPGFERFVIRHLDDMMTQDQDARIQNNVRHACPAQGVAFCSAVKKRFAELNSQKGAGGTTATADKVAH